jgi:hypothetical protein
VDAAGTGAFNPGTKTSSAKHRLDCATSGQYFGFGALAAPARLVGV